MLTAGARLGPYEIVGQLGAGGMGEVYRARDTRLGRDVAIKVLPAVFAADADRLHRFEQEARATAALNHPNILAIFDTGRHDGAPYIVEELLEGESLRERLRQGALPSRKAVEIAVAIAHGLAAAHAKGIVHRDLKPENVFLTSAGGVKILDFGLAKLTRDRAEIDLTAQPTASAPQIVLGTAAYMSPEQARGQPVDARSDIFALGALLYEMLAGRSPFRKATVADTASAILHEDPPPLAACLQACPPPLDTVVRRCLEKRPEDRFTTAHDLAIALEASSWSQPAAPGAAPAPALRRGRRLSAVAAVAVLIAVVASFGYFLAHRTGTQRVGRPEKLMLAVLPMENLSGDPQQDYFSDGLTEEMIAQLGRLEPKRLGVIARTSAMHYKHTTKTVEEIGRELRVQYVLEGSVRRDAGRVRITAQLIGVADQTPLWSESFERDQSAVFAVQAEVAERVARSLAIELLPGRKQALARAGTANPEAHEAYLRGLFLWNKRGGANLEQAAKLFERAINLDPEFAPAYVGLADAYVGLYADGWVPLAAAKSRVDSAVRKALELDPESAEAHATRAVVREYFYWDWPETGRELRRALELDPSCVKAHFSSGNFMRLAGRFDETIAHLREAARLDPASPRVNGQLGWVLSLGGRIDEARKVLDEIVRMAPDVATNHILLGRTLQMQGHGAEAAAEYRKAADLFSGGYRLLYQAYALAVDGKTREARGLLATINFEDRKDYVSPAEAAPVLVAASDLEGALDLAERAVSTHDGEALSLAYDPFLDPLRSNPRFAALLRRMDLPVVPAAEKPR